MASSSPRLKWRVILPTGNLLLASCLLLVGHHHYRTAPGGLQVTQEGWIFVPAEPAYLPPPTQVVYAINFPALLIRFPFMDLWKGVSESVFVVGIGIVWYIVGRILDSRSARRAVRPHWLSAVVAVAGVLVSLCGVGLWWKGLGMEYLIPPLGGLLWSVAIGSYCVSVLRRFTIRRACSR